MAINRKYWKGIDELAESPQFVESGDQEFPVKTSVEEFLGDEDLKESSTGRRDFLKFLGFSVAAATVAACEAPVTKAIPYVNKPENVTPGMPTWYASTYYDGNSFASILVKTREGRPIYIKGNRDHGISKGATNAQIIASVLGLYDSARLTRPQMKAGSDWSGANFSETDKKIKAALKSSKKVTLVSNTVISPSMLAAIGELSVSLGGTVNEETGGVTNENFEHIQYDAVSYAGMRAANLKSFGLATAADKDNGIIPDYNFAEAKTIVSVGADFLNSWLMPTQFSAQYAEGRNPDGEWMSQHFQFESVMTLTGSNADTRGMIKPSEQGAVLALILKGLGGSSDVSMKIGNSSTKNFVNLAIKALKKSKNHSLVVCGSNNTALQILTNKINAKLGAYTTTINVNNPINMFVSEDAKMSKFVSNVMNNKGPEAVIFMDTNPVYSLPNGAAFGKKLANVKHKISLAGYADETASLCNIIIPAHHALEDWMDYNPNQAHYSLAQPTIRPLGNTASSLETMLVFAGEASRGGKDSKVGYDYIQNLWMKSGYNMDPKMVEKYNTEGEFWNMMVHNSTGTDDIAAATAPSFDDAVLSGLSSQLPKSKGTEVILYQKAGIGIGTQANNPWLQELPDPLTKVTWDNYITMNPTEMEGTYATSFDQETGLTLATLKVGKNEVTLPVYPLPGQTPGTVGVALGYGRGANGEEIGTSAYQTKEYGGHDTDENGNLIPIGANAFIFAGMENGTMSYTTSGGSVTSKNETYPIAATQIHSTVMARHSVVKETTLGIYKSQGKEAYNPAHMLSKLDEHGNHVKAPVGEFDLWDAHPVEHIGHRWGMSIDLSSCIGCSACLIACQSENNVPVVGKDEVRRGRELHWLRIDRYFASGEEAAVGMRKDADTFSFSAAEVPEENPQVVHMPMMCHHCNHAPCETVCPVAATTHSNEGLNQMTYNRCIGTRYCANNCPYKVRRFNWFNYPSYKKFTEINPSQDDLGRMVLNPDVTVRTRGVMEKCSFCVQRIQAGKLDAKLEGRPVKDGDFATACADACPTNAITTGDWNDTGSLIRKVSGDDRAYQALEEIGVKPNVWFQVKVRNEENAVLAKLQKAEEHHEEHGNEHDAHAEHGQH
ncbi:MAG: MoCo/4Fe-4S cofactor protein with predicted Tat translocation signal [Flavobacteriaceae bacterium]|jgi:MoCo/4Fe-4S cofactor protein with predicted Tat translocation signal